MGNKHIIKSNENKKNVNGTTKTSIVKINPLIIDENATKNKKHLICDDAFSNRLVLKKYLDLFDCQVDEAENGQDAIDKVKLNGEYSIIWMDIKMPKMDGIEATEGLRQLKYSGAIIGLTGFVDDITVKKCYDVGMNHVVSKPFDKNVILMYVDKYKS